jgi:cytochrome P450
MVFLLATLLSGLIFCLLSQPEIWKILTHEIRTSFSTTEDLSFERLAECKYLSACLKEALRIYPPVPIGSPRVIPENGRQVLGRWIPQGTRVSVHHYSTYHSRINFRDPDAFVPERWLGDLRYANDVQDAHQPFGWGHRNCLGQNMAMHEMRLILASVILRFDFQLCDESRDWLDQRTFVLWRKTPLMCEVTRVCA